MWFRVACAKAGYSMTSTPLDLARTLALKADHDIEAVELLMAQGATDVICFHLQQAAEKILKAYLQACSIEFPRTHDLDALLDICAVVTDRLEVYRDRLEVFIPYAVMLRYDLDYEPTREETRVGLVLVREMRACLTSLRPELGTGSTE